MPKTAKEFVDDAINSQTAVIFTGPFNIFEKQAREALTKEGIKSIHRILLEDEKPNQEEMPNQEEIVAYLRELTNQYTLPMIFVAKVFIGGSDDTLNAISRGKIRELLLPFGETD